LTAHAAATANAASATARPWASTRMIRIVKEAAAGFRS
jgi:hypothetical protein